MTALSLNQAAARGGVSRWTVSRALQAAQLRGMRDNRGRWRVEPEDLDTWAAEQSPVQPERRTVLQLEQDRAEPILHVEQHGAAPVQAVEVEVAVLRVQLEALAGQLDREREDRVHDRATVEDLRERLDRSEEERRTLQARLLMLPEVVVTPEPVVEPEPEVVVEAEPVAELLQESPKASEVVVTPPSPLRVLWGRLLGR